MLTCRFRDKSAWDGPDRLQHATISLGTTTSPDVIISDEWWQWLWDNQKLVFRAAKKYLGTLLDDISYDELVNCIAPRFLRYMQRYDPAKGKLTTWAYKCLGACFSGERGRKKGSGFHFYVAPRDMTTTGRYQSPLLLGWASEDSLQRTDDKEDKEPDDRLVAQATNAFCQLDHRTVVMISMHYGLEGGRGATLKEIGEQFGITRERVRQIITRGLNKIRRSMGLAEKGLAEKGTEQSTDCPATKPIREGRRAPKSDDPKVEANRERQRKYYRERRMRLAALAKAAKPHHPDAIQQEQP